MPLQFKLDEPEIRELRLAVDDRAEKLEKLRKALAAARLSTKDIEEHLLQLLGDDATPGLAGRLSEQLTIFEAPDA